jgi:hypothetical protein
MDMTRTQQVLLTLAGFYHLGLAVFHVFFWKLFHWKKELGRMSKINGGILQVMNLCLVYGFLAASMILFFFQNDLVGTRLGRTFLIGLALFWAARAVEHVVFFVKTRGSILFIAIFLTGAWITVLPLI